jgi:hypothetical protein
VLTAVVLLYVFGIRSLQAMTNYTEMDMQARQGMDHMLRDMRQGYLVTDYQMNLPTRWLKLAITNAVPGTMTTNTYLWDSVAGTVMASNDTSAVTYLTGCDDWSCALFLRDPGPSGGFYQMTNGQALGFCKLIQMTWSCSRSNISRKFNTEATITAEVVLRNKR